MGVRRVHLPASAALVVASLVGAAGPAAGIHNGEETSAPWVVRIDVSFTKDGRRHTPTCSGVVISARVVMTAAHCLYRDRHELHPNLAVTLHISNSDIKPIRMAHFDEWRGSGNKSFRDVALVQLERSLRTTPPVKVAEPRDSVLAEVGDTVQIWGWGPVDAAGTEPSTPRYASVRVRPEDMNTGGLFGWLGVDALDSEARSYVFAVARTNQRISCKGDSGGPMTARRADGTRVVLGVIKGGDIRKSCGDSEWAIVSAVNGTNIRRWIVDQTNRWRAGTAPIR